MYCNPNHETTSASPVATKPSSPDEVIMSVPARDLHCDECGGQDEFTRRSGVAHRRLIERILFHALDLPDAMLIVASDQDFSYAIRDLVEDGYNVMTAVESGDESVAMESTVSWLWGEIQQGNGANMVKAVRERKWMGAQ